MFYVSRYVYGRIFVTDTTDGVEEVVSRLDLKELLERGIEIKGVTPTWRVNSRGRRLSGVNVEVYPYANMGLSSKMQLLAGINMVVDNDGNLVKLGFDDLPVGAEFELVLSEYCKRVTKGSFVIGFGNGKKAGKVRIVFDDNLETVDFAFVDILDRSRAIFDLSRVTREDIADTIYRSIFRAKYWNYTLSDNFIDPDEKRRYFKSVEYLINYIEPSMLYNHEFEEMYTMLRAPINEELDTYLHNRGLCKKILKKIPSRVHLDVHRLYLRDVEKISYIQSLRVVVDLVPKMSSPKSWYIHHKLYAMFNTVGIRTKELAKNDYMRLAMYVALGGRDTDLVKALRQVLRCILDALTAEG